MVLLHRLCFFSLQNPVLLSEDRKDRVVLILGNSLQLFTIPFITDSMHELKAGKKKKSLLHLMKMKDNLETSERAIFLTVKSQRKYLLPMPFFFFVQDGILRCFVPLKMSVKHTWRMEREILSECIKWDITVQRHFRFSLNKGLNIEDKARTGRAFFPHVLLKLFRIEVEQILF